MAEITVALKLTEVNFSYYFHECFSGCEYKKFFYVKAPCMIQTRPNMSEVQAGKELMATLYTMLTVLRRFLLKPTDKCFGFRIQLIESVTSYDIQENLYHEILTVGRSLHYTLLCQPQ